MVQLNQEAAYISAGNVLDNMNPFVDSRRFDELISVAKYMYHRNVSEDIGYIGPILAYIKNTGEKGFFGNIEGIKFEAEFYIPGFDKKKLEFILTDLDSEMPLNIFESVRNRTTLQ